MKRFQVQHAGRPFGPCETIQWIDEPLFETDDLAAARKRCDWLHSEMKRDTHTPNAWTDHFRVIATVDTQMTQTFYCEGYDSHGDFEWTSCSNSCPDHATAKVRFTWAAGTVCPDTPIPDGWYDFGRCHQCGERHTAERSRIEHYEINEIAKREQEALAMPVGGDDAAL